MSLAAYAGKADHALDRLNGLLLMQLPEARRIKLLSNRLLSLRLSPARQYNARAILLAYAGDLKTAIELLINNISKNPGHLYSVENLGYILFYLADRPTQQYAWELLERQKVTRMANAEAPRLLMLVLALMLELDIEGAVRKTDHDFIKKLVEPNILNRCKKPIFFWHIPKCIGTSINQTFYSYFYRCAEADIIPSYSSYPLLAHCVKNMDSLFPYIPSAHCAINELTPPENSFTFTVMRDPQERVLSMFRQISSALSYGGLFRQLSSYGYFLPKWKCQDLASFIDALPKSLLLKQIGTFSQSLDIPEAQANIQKLDYYIIHGRNVGNFNDLFKAAGVPLTEQQVPTGLNKTFGGTEIDAQDARYLANAVEPEYQLLRQLGAECRAFV